MRQGKWKYLQTRDRIALFDLENDPGETNNLAAGSEHAALVNDLLGMLAEHMVRTARYPALGPRTNDPHVILEHCLPPTEEARQRGGL